ncbi:MAG: hypothetical protein HYR63_05720 [Proteobacteria bacterium]|nr:hypothetical protein [Pseudomonadota bacterium]MBI3495804.1 hypothetical protein [Pseudomonadota bacterium]
MTALGGQFLLFWPGWDGLLGVAASVAVFLGFAAIGSRAGKRRFAAADVVVGWGVGAGAVTLLGTLSHGPLTLWGGGLAAVAILAAGWQIRRGEAIAGAWLWPILALMLPLLLLVAGSGFTNWDDFTHWLPNAGYLYRFDAFPRADLPPSPSVSPAYPYGLPLWSFFVSEISGRFVERAGALANVLLLGAFAAILAALIAEHAGIVETRRTRWGIAALGLLGASALNPGFAPSFAITAWSDSATSVALGTTGVLGWRLLEHLRDRDREAARILAWQFGFAATALVNLRQANPVLLVLLMIGIGLIVLRDPEQRPAPFLRLLPIMLGPPLLLTLAWRHYVAGNIPGGEFHFLPIAEWRLAELPKILDGAFRQSYPKAYYYEMLALSALGLAGLWRPHTAFARLAALVAVVFLGYVGFLLFAYVAAAFPAVEAERAASFWRYSTHAALLGMAAAVYGLTQLWSRWRRRREWPTEPAGIALATLVPLMVLVFPSALVRPVRPEEAFIRGIGHELADSLPAGAKLAVILPDGLVHYMLNYELMRLGREDRGLSASMYVDDFMGAEMRQRRLIGLASDATLRYAFTLGRYPEGVQALSGDLAANEAALYVREPSAWRLARRWQRPAR